jgi:hypothetical protein
MLYFKVESTCADGRSYDTAYQADADTESNTVDGYCGFQGLDPDDRVDWSTATTDDGSEGNISQRFARTLECYLVPEVWNMGRFLRSFMLFDTSSIGSNVVTDAVYSFTSNQATDKHQSLHSIS